MSGETSERGSLFSPRQSWVVAVRNERDDLTFQFYGVYGSEASAQRKAAAISKRLHAAGAEVADAYACPLEGATTPANSIAAKAMVERIDEGPVF